MKAAVLLLALAACGSAEVVTVPVMAPVDHPRPPNGIAAACGVAWEPIRLPTTAGDQIAGRQRDRAAAEAAIAECERRRSRAVRFLRRLGFDL